jgi:hypothetical protein
MSGSQLERVWISPTGRWLPISEDIFNCYDWNKVYAVIDIWWVEGRVAAKYPAMYGTAPLNNSPSPISELPL